MSDHRHKRPYDVPPAAKRAREPSAPTFPTYKDAPDLPPKIRLLCEILASSASNVEAALDDADVRVTSADVEQVVRFSYAHPRAAVAFFRWAGHRHLRHQHSPYSWNLVVDLLGKNRLFELMWDTVSSMQSQGLLSLATFASVFSSLAANPASTPLKAFVEMPLYGMERDTSALNSLLSALCRASRLDDARAAIPVARAEAGTRPDADSYAILLEGCEAAADPSVAREVFDEMVRTIGLDPANVPATLGSSGPSYGIGMKGFRDDHGTYHQSEQHSARASDSVEDAISDEDVVAPARLSLACAASKQREKDNRMVDQHESAVWDEVLEEADELAYVHKAPLNVSFLSAGTSKRSKCENRLRFSIRGSNSAALNVKTEKSYFGEQEVSSGLPPTKASQTMLAELLENINEETEGLPSEFARPIKKAHISVAELLEDLQDRSGSSVGTPFSLHQHTRAKEGKLNVPTSGKKILALLGQRSLDGEDPLEHVIGETSSEEEDIVQNHLTLVNKDVKGQTMADLFQEAFNAAIMEGTALPMRSNGAGYYGRMQQIMQMEKDKHAEFLRQYNREQDYLGGP